ncbi:MAG: tubulin/FtsZ family protein, partial [Planctomycetota bacterium]|nr:tubulin/FtsZ family protein [Planctomycetota bacterium]
TDVADLSGLTFIHRDQSHRILIGGQKIGGHGVGKINELAAEIAKEDSDKVLEAIQGTPQFLETDAFLIAASASGGTGSGALPILTYTLKERYPEKPTYNLVVLPFRHEEISEERTVPNTATCLKTAYLVSDGIFLVDNDRFVRNSQSIQGNLARINRQIADPFYDLLCAGEEKQAKFIGSRVLDAGDIMQTLSGWTVLGHGESRRPWFTPRFGIRRDFRNSASDAEEQVQALNAAIGDLSLKCNPRDAHKALYLLSAPPGDMNLSLVKELGTSLKTLASEAVIRSGDYPRKKQRSLSVTVILSEFSRLDKITDYFNKAAMDLSAKKKQGKTPEQIELEDTFKDIPTLL